MRKKLAGAAIFAILCLQTADPTPALQAPAGAQPQPTEWERLESEFSATYRLSVEAYQRRALAEAEPAARRALQLAEFLYGPQHESTIYSVFSLAAALQGQRRYTEAEPLLIRAIAGFDRIRDGTTGALLRAYNNLGLLYTYQARYREAEPLVRRAIELSRQFRGETHPDTIRLTRTLATMFSSQGRFSEAEPILLQLTAGDSRDLATLENVTSLCFVYLQMGRYGDAEQRCRRSIAGLIEAVGPEHERTLLAIQMLGETLTFQGRFDEAEQFLRRAAERSEAIYGADSANYGHAAAALGYHFQFRGRYQDAEVFNSRAVPLFVRYSGAQSRNTLGVTMNLAETYGSLGRYVEATGMLQRALEQLRPATSANDPLIFEIINELGDLSLAQSRWEEAERHYGQAVEGRRQALGASHPDTIESTIGLALARLQSGRRSPSAIEPARAAVAGMRERRALSERASQRSYVVRDHSLLADAIWTDGDSRRRDPRAADEAFLALQDSIAGTTDRALTQMAIRHLADIQQPGLGALVRERESLAEQLAANDRAYGESFTSSDAEAGNARVRLAETRAQLATSLARVDSDLRRQFPDYFSLVRPEAVNAAAVRALLTEDEAVLLIVPGRFGTHVIAINRSTTQWHRSSWTEAQVTEAVARLHNDIARTMRNRGYRYDRATAHALYRELVLPMVPTLGNRRHVFVVSGGVLTGLPLGILVVDPPTGEDNDPVALRGTRWLADVYALSQLPSVQSLRILRQPGRAAAAAPADGPHFVGFGDPVLAEAPPAGRAGSGSGPITFATLFSTPRAASEAGLADVGQLRRLSRLPGTATELENMRAALGAPRDSLYLGPRATERTFRTIDLRNARILALATHGLVAGEVGGLGEPGLVFTPPDRSSADDDGYLTASEVASLRLNADWVILSACNTAAGDGSAGAPGLSGLARAFFYAGARNLLASHWLVADDAAPRLTVRTLELMRQDPSLSRAQALQRSMREVREDPARRTWAHPGIWGAFSLIGDGAN